MQANSLNKQLPLWDGMINNLQAKLTNIIAWIVILCNYCISKMNENYWILFTLNRNFIQLSNFLEIPAFLLSGNGRELTIRSAVPSPLPLLTTKIWFHHPLTLRLQWPL
jgi:hypothetical protein